MKDVVLVIWVDEVYYRVVNYILVFMKEDEYNFYELGKWYGSRENSVILWRYFIVEMYIICFWYNVYVYVVSK